MQGVIIFRHHDSNLLRFEFPMDDPERIGEFIHLAYDEFRKQFPSVLLMDNVTVIFDKA